MPANRPEGAIEVAGNGLLGGFIGGATVGLVEAAVVAADAGAGAEYWVLPYGLIAYGTCGAVLAVAGCLVAFALGWRANSLGRATIFGFAPTGFAVGRYLLVQRIFHEQISLGSRQGLAMQAGLVAIVAIASWVLSQLGQRLARAPRRRLLASLLVIVPLVVSVGVAAIASSRTIQPSVTARPGSAVGERPSLIVIILDTLRVDAIGAYGGNSSVTPALDDFARGSVRFTHAYGNSTWTRPSVATILTSLFPSEHQAIHKADALPGEVTTLAEALRARGYFTAGIVSNINLAPIFNFEQGFDQYQYLEPSFYFGASDSASRLAIYKGLRAVRERYWGDRLYVNHYYRDAPQVNAAVFDWLAENPPRPSFLLIHYMDPHDPYFEIPYNGSGVARVVDPNPPPTNRDRMHALYLEDVAYLDEHLRELFARLRKVGWFDDSVIAVLADHGEEFQEHGGWWHGTTLYEEQLHIPLLLKRAREPQPGSTNDRFVSTIDVAPTVMAALGLEIPDEFHGRDVFSAESAGVSPLFAENDFEGTMTSSIRLGRWKLVEANPKNPRGLKPIELYDLDSDPGETVNRAASQPELVEQMSKELRRHRAAEETRTP